MWGNYIGTSPGGDLPLGNTYRGVILENGAQGNSIGAIWSGAGNVISANGTGILIQHTATGVNTVVSNLIGTDATGMLDLGNSGPGINISYSSNNVVGGTTPAERNVISGNGGDGVAIAGGDASGNAVRGNYIGVAVDGTTNLGNTNSGVAINVDAHDNTIGGALSTERNVISGNGTYGVSMSGGSQNWVAGNYIGVDATGLSPQPNGFDGALLLAGTDNTIGGTTAGARNVIAGNYGSGVVISGGSGNIVEGNLIGTDATGLTGMFNASYGVRIEDSPANVIGGAAAGARNVIAASICDGVSINGPGSHDNAVEGNYIGTGLDGWSDLGNGMSGVAISGGASSNRVGGVGEGEGNVLAYNQGAVTVADFGSNGNTVRGNSIHNSDLAFPILLTGGANDSIAVPSILSVTGTTVTGYACPGCTVDFYSDGGNEGRYYHGSTVASLGGTFTAEVDYIANYLTATQTNAYGSTSQFTNHELVIEPCDGIDNDADTQVDEGNTDTDSDGAADCVDPDDDDDGVFDGSDSCPLIAEDVDGFEDADGCPDTDNDSDGIPDASDSGQMVFDPAVTLPDPTVDCKNIPEDFDGFKDDDGCPEPDNDNDGFPNTTDACPGTDAHAGPDGMLGSPEDLNHNGIKDPSEDSLTTDDVVKTFEDYDGVLDGDGCHDSPGDDFDGDGFTDEIEALSIGTDAGRWCPHTTVQNDEDPDPWPPDFNDNASVNIVDALFFGPVIGSSSGDPNYDPRFDLNANGAINIVDVLFLGPVIGTSCTPTG